MKGRKEKYNNALFIWKENMYVYSQRTDCVNEILDSIVSSFLKEEEDMEII